MKQINRWAFFKSNVWYTATLAIMLFSFFGIQQINSASNICILDSCKTCTVTGISHSITFTLSYPTCVCVGDTFTIVGTFEVNSGYAFLGFETIDFAPDPAAPGSQTPGLFPNGTQTGPFPFITGVSYVAANGTNTCPGSFGQGRLAVPSGPVITPNVVYTYSFDVTATASGLQTWFPNVSDSGCVTLYTVTILVNPRAQVFDETLATGCENAAVTGTLPAPSGTTGAFFFDVGSPTGGNVILNNATSGDFTFTPAFNFTGTASFQYNVNSTGPGLPEFCPASPSGTVTIPIAQSPIVSNGSITVCAGANTTGSLVPFVTGGSGNFSFTGPISLNCTGANVSINPSGIFSFTAPTGSVIPCNFSYEVTDTTPPNCTGIGTISVTINPSPIANNQTVSDCVNQSVSGTLTASGGSGIYTNFAIVTPPTNGVAVITNPATGTFTYTPNAGFSGTDSFTFNVTDSHGCTSVIPGIVTINVNPLPIVSNTSVTGCENTPFTGSLTGLVTGGTGPLVFSATGPSPSCGVVAISSDGSYIFSPNPDTIGSCSFEFTVTASGCSPTAPGTVTVNIAQGPLATGGATGICASGTVNGNLNDFVISAPPVVSFTGGPGFNGILNLNPASGVFTFTPTISSGTATFPFQVLSSALPCPSPVETFLVTVHPKPVVTTGMIAACSGNAKSGNLNPLVSGESPFTFTLSGAPVGGTVVLQPSGLFTFTPFPGFTNGSFNFIVSSSFGCTAAGTELVTINPSPNAASGTALDCGGQTVTGSLSPLVSGGTPPYLFSVSSPVNGMVTVGQTSGIFAFTANTGVTSGSFVYRVADQNACSATAPIFVTINPGPQTIPGAFTACQNATINNTLTGLVTDSSPPLTFFETGPLPTCGIVGVNPDGTFTFIPNPDFIGSCNFEFQVTDSGTPACTSQVTNVTVTFEEAPVALNGTFDACQNTPFASGLNNLVSGGFPPFMFFETGPAPTCGTVVVNTDGSFTFVPNPGFTGPCSFQFFVADSTPCFSNSATATINVHPTPIASNSGPINICENTKFCSDLNLFITGGTPPFSFTTFNAINGSVSLNPSGPFCFNPIPNFTGPGSFQFRGADTFGCLSNTGTLSFNINQPPSITAQSPLLTCQNTPVNGTVTATGGTPPYTFSVVSVMHGTITAFNPATGAFTFTPAFNFIGNAMVVIQVTDSIGCSSKVGITITVEPKPIVSNTSVASCQPVVFGSLTGLVSGGTPPFTFLQTGPITCGSVTINPNGTFVFTGPSGFTGPCTFEFEVIDNTPAHCFATGLFTIAQTATPPPVVSDGSFCACFNTPVSGSLAALVTGGTPPFRFMIVGPVIGGTVVLNPLTGFFTFKPFPEFTGVASFQFIAEDSSNVFCQSNIGTVTISVPCCFGTTGVLG